MLRVFIKSSLLCNCSPGYHEGRKPDDHEVYELFGRRDCDNRSTTVLSVDRRRSPSDCLKLSDQLHAFFYHFSVVKVLSCIFPFVLENYFSYV